MQQYEYCLLDTWQEGCPLGEISPTAAWSERLESGLNDIVRDGWLLVEVIGNHLMIFARPKESQP